MKATAKKQSVRQIVSAYGQDYPHLLKGFRAASAARSETPNPEQTKQCTKPTTKTPHSKERGHHAKVWVPKKHGTSCLGQPRI